MNEAGLNAIRMSLASARSNKDHAVAARDGAAERLAKAERHLANRAEEVASLEEALVSADPTFLPGAALPSVLFNEWG